MGPRGYLTLLTLEMFLNNAFWSCSSQGVFWSLLCYKELKLTMKPFTGRTLCSLFDPDAKYYLVKFGHAQAAKFLDSLLVYKWHRGLDFYFLLSLLPSFFAFLASFFSFAGHLVGFILVRKAFGKALIRILRLDERKGTCTIAKVMVINISTIGAWVDYSKQN